MLGFGLQLSSRAVRQSAGAPFSPSSLPLAAWFDPSDLSTLFQDSAGTIPVAADGDPVGLMLDKSGNGYHLGQATAAKRPVFRQAGARHWLESDGVDDILVQASRLGFAVNPAITVVVGLQEIATTAADARVFHLGSNAGSPAGSVGTDGYSWRFNNGNERYQLVPSGVDQVVTWARPQGGTYADSRLFIDGVENARVSVANGQSLPSSTAQSFAVFGQTTTTNNFSNIRLYGMIVGAFDDPALRASAEGWMAKKTG